MAASQNTIISEDKKETTALGVREVIFERRFNVGLTLDTNLKEFTAFIKDYGKYIYSFYFSPPLGSTFQTRAAVNKQFKSKSKENLFWNMLTLARENGIKLELLFNTPKLEEHDIAEAARLLDERGLSPDSVCFMEKYAEAVQKHFKNQEYVLSFNNGHLTEKSFDALIQRINVDTIVLGGEVIRNNSFFAHIKECGKRIILLLNNGCSFNCPTCNAGAKFCKEFFEENKKNHTVEYLYALQSIFPCEIRDGTIDESLIDLFKISNRSSNITFTKGAIDSYVTGNVRKCLRFDKTHYAYWGRLGHFWPYFPLMRLEKIIAYKEEILGHPIDVL